MGASISIGLAAVPGILRGGGRRRLLMRGLLVRRRRRAGPLGRRFATLRGLPADLLRRGGNGPLRARGWVCWGGSGRASAGPTGGGGRGGNGPRGGRGGVWRAGSGRLRPGPRA